jgi:non-canonical purine NTP pyrophosphatase (RdgB/HAM1 family)
MSITFITGNEHKAKYVSAWLGMPIEHKKLDLDELQTLDLHKLVDHKVKQAYGILKTPVLIEDAQLVFHALGKLPGPFIKFFVEELGPLGIVRMMQAFDDRRATGRICFALYDGREIRYFEGDMTGRIAHEPRGTGGFGFDSIFINDGYAKTRAEMTEEEYEESSYRKQALDKLRAYLAHEG